MEDNLEDYVGGKISTTEKQILMKKCSKAWGSLSRSSVVSTNVDGSENQEVHIEKIPDYQMTIGDDELKKDFTSDDDSNGVESNDGDEYNYVENESGAKENVIAS